MFNPVIPGGQPMLLQRGEQVVVTQTLGGSATVQTEMGYLVRISAEDSAALGLTGTAAEATFADGENTLFFGMKKRPKLLIPIQ